MKQKIFTNLLVVLFIAFSATTVFGQQEIFKRTALIHPPVNENGGYGDAVIGDVTGSGMPQIYAVNDDWTDTGGELIPKIYEFKFDGVKWDSVWSAVLPLPAQNTWPALAIADLDGDGKKEVVWGPVNNLSDANPNPSRIVVFEAQGGSSDNLGVADGSGGFKPNAEFSITDSTKFELRPFRWVIRDVNNDGKQEIIFADRQSNYRFGVVSVDNIPDDGTGTVNWKLDASGLGSSMSTSTIYDLAVMDSTIYLIHSNGTVTPVFYANGNYTIGPDQVDAIPGGSWKSAQTVDLNNDGKKEIVVGQWSGGSQVYLLEKNPTADTLDTYVIGDFASLGSTRLNGGAVGDVDNDGHLDFIYGSRSGYATPHASIYRFSYMGGDITSPTSYKASIIDSSLMAGGQYDVVAVGNADSDAGDEVVYSGTPRGSDPIPLVVLKSMKVDNLSTIANARIDSNNDYQPDSLGKVMKVIGVVNAPNLQGNANFSYTIQDGNSGILLFKSGTPNLTLNYGDRVLVTGTVAQYRGTTELSVADPANDITVLDTGRVVSPYKTTIESYLANPESVESRLIELDGVAKTASSEPWPSSGSSANMTIWDGYKTLVLRIDSDTDVDDNPEPTYPMDIIGVSSQYTSSSSVYDDGYQITPGYYKDITQDVAVLPSPYFFFPDEMHQQAQKGPLTVTDSAETDTVMWTSSIDLNGDNIGYAFVVYKIGSSTPALTIQTTDTVAYIKGTDILKVLGGQDTVQVYMTLFAQGAETNYTSSVDTIYATIVNDIVTGVQDKFIPKTFFVDQNYPNPFNPTTTIRFGLQQQGSVSLIIYDILGQRVAVLLSNQVMQPGTHEVQFNASRLASGTYIYRLKAGQHVVTKKMILLK